MSEHELWLTRKDLRGFEEISRLVRDCTSKTADDAADEYWTIAKLLYSNVVSLDLDESLLQICDLARRFAAELVAPDLRRRGFPQGVWHRGAYSNFPPYRKKIGGANSQLSLIRSREKQQIAMMNVLAHILLKDPELRGGAQVLLEYERMKGLLPEEDALDWDV